MCSIYINNDIVRSLHSDAIVSEDIVQNRCYCKYCTSQAKLPFPSGEATYSAYTVTVVCNLPWWGIQHPPNHSRLSTSPLRSAHCVPCLSDNKGSVRLYSSSTAAWRNLGWKSRWSCAHMTEVRVDSAIWWRVTPPGSWSSASWWTVHPELTVYRLEGVRSSRPFCQVCRTPVGWRKIENYKYCYKDMFYL